MARAQFRTELLSDVAEDGDDGNRWILSYADFITLMFAFFVVMYSVSSVNDGKFRVLSETMLNVFQNPEVAAAVEQRLVERARLGAGQSAAALDDAPGPLPAGIADPSTLSADALAEVLITLMAEPIAGGQVRVRASEDWTEVEFDHDFAFTADAMQVTPQASTLVARIAELARAVDTPVRVEGFTDNVPRAGGVYGSNWELSAAYAARLAEALVTAGATAGQVSASGFGAQHPVASNATAEGRRRNQRVVVAIARHDNVPQAVASLAARVDAPETLPARTLERVTELPPPAGITL